jgi:hypothetical protein
MSAIIPALITDVYHVIDPQPFLEQSATGNMWGHRDLGGTFAEHVFPACFVALVRCPFGSATRIERVGTEGTWAWVVPTALDDFIQQRPVPITEADREAARAFVGQRLNTEHTGKCACAQCELSIAQALANHAESRAASARAEERLDVRPEVAAFALLMEAKLRENDHKGGWHGEDTEGLLRRLREETDELETAMKRGPGTEWPYGARQKPQRTLIGREAADVANFAMMLADVCGAISRRSP